MSHVIISLWHNNRCGEEFKALKNLLRKTSNFYLKNNPNYLPRAHKVEFRVHLLNMSFISKVSWTFPEKFVLKWESSESICNYYWKTCTLLSLQTRVKTGTFALLTAIFTLKSGLSFLFDKAVYNRVTFSCVRVLFIAWVVVFDSTRVVALLYACIKLASRKARKIWPDI